MTAPTKTERLRAARAARKKSNRAWFEADLAWKEADRAQAEAALGLSKEVLARWAPLKLKCEECGREGPTLPIPVGAQVVIPKGTILCDSCTEKHRVPPPSELYA